VENPVPLRVLHEQLNTFGAEEFEAIALKGVGVFDTLKAVSKQILKVLRT